MTTGRIGLNHPALGTAGGSALWTLINNIYQALGDAVPGRYLTASAVANASTVTLTHGYGASFSEYRYALYSASSGVLGSRITTGWTIVANASNPTTAVDVTNNSGSTSDIVLVLLHDGGNYNYTYVDYQQLSGTPAVPASGVTRVYPKTDGNLYQLNSAGTEQVIGSTGSGLKNYVPTASQSGIGSWTGVGMTLAIDTTPADLPRANTTKQGLKLTMAPVNFVFTITASGTTLTSSTAHGMQTGYVAFFSTTGILPGGLSAATPYYITVLSTTTFAVSTSMANLVAGTFVAMTATGSGTNNAAYSVAYLRFALDSADYGVVQLVQLAQNALSGYVSNDFHVDAWANTSSSYNGTSTRLPLSTDVAGTLITGLPAANTTYKTSFGATSAANPYLEIRVLGVTQSLRSFVISDFYVGPSAVVQGPAVSAWQSYTPTYSTSFGTVTSSLIQYRRVGDSIEVKGTFIPGTTGGGIAKISLPSGLTLNTAAISSNGNGAQFGTFQSAGITAGNFGLAWDGTDATSFVFLKASANQANGSDVASSGGVVGVWASAPIAQWAGSGTINVVQNDIEYASNNNVGTTAGTVYSTGFAYGPSGSPIQNIASTVTTAYSSTAYYVQFQTPILPTDFLQVEFDYGSGGTFWIAAASANRGSIVQNTAQYGITINYINATTVAVGFGNAGQFPNGSTYGSAGVSWAGGGFNWRVRKIKAGVAVGFGTVNATSAGLMPATNTNLDNGSATRLGLMQYYGNTAYANGTPTITCSQAGFALSRAVLIPYQMNDGTWRLKFSISGSFTTATITNYTVSISGIVASSLYNTQAVTAATSGGTGLSPKNAFVAPSSNNVSVYFPSFSENYATVAGDIELSAKPTWAT